MEEKFLEFVAEVFEVSTEEISMETAYGEFEEWDSLMMLTLVMEIEEEYGVRIPMEKVGKIKTLYDMFSFIVEE